VRWRGRRARASRSERATSPTAGQATVELALGLPLVVMLMLLVAQVGLVLRDQVLVTHAAREAVRAASVLPRGDVGGVTTAAARAGPLDRSRLEVEVTPADSAADAVRVVVRYRCVTELPLIGALVPDLTLRAEAVMRIE
jgi:Flp pilus assembly protein TadG